MSMLRWLSGALVLWKYKDIIGVAVLMGWGLGGLWAFTLRREDAHFYQYIPFGWGLLGLTAIGEGFIPAAWRNLLGWLLCVAGAGAFIFWLCALWRKRHKALLLLLLWQGLVVWPWSFGDVTTWLVPPYSDAAVHYALLKNNYAGIPLPGVVFSLHRVLHLQTYYHLGFHGLLGWITWLRGLPSPIGMFAIATIFPIMVLPHTMYWLAYHVWKHHFVAFFVGWASALAWAMPLHALGWGKFPALFALALAPLVLLLVVPSLESGNAQRYAPWLVIGFVTLFWAHARIGSLTLALVTLLKIWQWQGQRRPLKKQRWLQAIVVTWLIFGSALLWYRGIYWRFYSPWVWLLLLLAVSGLFRKSVDITQQMPLWAGIVAMTLLVTAANTAVPAWLHRGTQVWVDRPTFELIAPLPLAWLLGAVSKPYISLFTHRKLLQWSGAGLAVVGLTAFSWQHAYHVASQLVYFQEDDQVAFSFLQRIKPEGVILVHGYDRWHPNDGGVWISPLLGYPTYTLPQERWWQSDTLATLCAQYPEIWVYVDFNPGGFLPPPERPYLSLEIFLPTVQVYRVDCTAVTK